MPATTRNRPKRLSLAELSPEQRWYLPRPEIVLFGVGPYSPASDTDPATGKCRVCLGDVVDRPDTVAGDPANRQDVHVYCACCDAMADRWERNAARQRVETAAWNHELDRRKSEDAHFAAIDKAIEDQTYAPPMLSERDRRRIWFGYKVPPDWNARIEPTSVSRICRLWLFKIGQLPNWELILDSKGRVIDREPAVAELVD